MSDFSTLDLLIENMDSSLDGPLSSREVECVAKGWRQGEATANAEIARLQAENEALRVALEDMVNQVERDTAMGLCTVTSGCIEVALDALERQSVEGG